MHGTCGKGHTHFRAARSAASIKHLNTLTCFWSLIIMLSAISTPESSLLLSFMAPLGIDALLELVVHGEADVLEKAHQWDGARKVRHAPD